MKRRFLATLLALCLVLGLLPETARAAVSDSGTCGSNVNWTLENGTLTISGSGAMYNYNAWYDTSTINTELKADTPWFSMRTNIKSVKIENGITAISSYAFLKCNFLSQVKIPSTVSEINRSAFRGCESLKQISIPDGVAIIDTDTFNGCDSLAYINIPDSVTHINGQAFAGCKGLTNINLPKNLSYIGKAAFVSAGLTSVELPEGLTTIAELAFDRCADMRYVSIPGSVRTIGAEAFSYCTSLTSIAIPSSVGTIGSGAFSSCTSLRDVTISDGVESIGGFAFGDCDGLTTIFVPSSVTTIGNYAFASPRLREIIVDGDNPRYCAIDGVLYTKDLSTLVMCPEGKTGRLVIPDGVTTFGAGEYFGPLYDCEKLTSLTIPGSVTTTGFVRVTDAYGEGPYRESWGTFIGCSGLTSAGPIGSGCDIEFGWTKAIPDATFEGATSLITVVLPDGLTSLEYTFSGCTSLETVYIPDSMKTIGKKAFGGCTSLSTLVIPDGVTSIGREAFRGCTSLTSLTIPKSVIDIDVYGLEWGRDCPDLTIYCYKDSTAHQYAQQFGIQFVLLDGGPDEPDVPNPSIQTITLTRDDVSVDLLITQTDFTQGAGETAIVNVAVDWDGGEAGRVFLIQSRDRYVELSVENIVPGAIFTPGDPIYVIATDAAATEILDWKLTKLQIVEPVPPPDDDFTVNLSLWDDESCTRRITSMTNTYGSFSWDKNGSDNSDFDTAYLKFDYTGKIGEGAETVTLTVPDGFSFYPDVMMGTKEISLWSERGTSVYPVYPIYSEAEETELVFTVTNGDASLIIPAEKNSGEGEIYYRDSFDKPGNLALEPWHMKNLSLAGFSRTSTQYDHHLAMLSVALSAASYKYDGVRDTLRNFGFSNMETHDSYMHDNYMPWTDQISKDQNSVASVFATKKYVVDGSICTIVAVVIRGTVENEWYSNFDVGSGSTHYGFFLSKQDVLMRLVSYMKKLQDKGLKADQTKMLITGHSRAAAVADLLTVDLNTAYLGKYAGYDNIYTYTFATPNSMTSVNGRHDNIYNIMNYQDVVAHVPGMFQSPGNNLYVNNPFSKNYDMERSLFEAYFKYYVTNNSLHKPKYDDWGDEAVNVIATFDDMDKTDLINEYGPGLADVALGKVSLNAVNLCLRLIFEATKTGASKGTDIGKIAGSIAGNPGEVIGGSLGALIGGCIGFKDGVDAEITAYKLQDDITNLIFSNHAIETYMCWMNVLSAFSNNLNGARVKIMCPVDVTVYDEDGIPVSKIVNNEVALSEGPYCGVVGEEKIFYLANSDYTFRITGYDNGSMDIEIAEYDETNSKTKFISYEDIPVVRGESATLTAQNCGETNSQYSLVVDNIETQPDHTVSGAGIDAVQIQTSTEGNGYVIGGGNYTAGERVTLYALANSSMFNGWYVDNMLVSDAEIYQFSAENAIHITARCWTAKT